MLLLSMEMTPILPPGVMMDGMILDRETGRPVPGAILKLWLELRKTVGVLQARTKDKVKFKVRSTEELIDKIRDKCNDLGILIYPGRANGRGHVVEDGTLADVTLTVIAQAIEDGSLLQFEGFGLGADGMDKAGGKAGTYAFKAALIQALLAGGKDNAKALGVVDTDDTDAPIPGGIKPKKAVAKALPITVQEAKELFIGLVAGDKDGYTAAVKRAMALSPEDQMTIMPEVKAAKARTHV